MLAITLTPDTNALLGRARTGRLTTALSLLDLACRTPDGLGEHDRTRADPLLVHTFNQVFNLHVSALGYALGVAKWETTGAVLLSAAVKLSRAIAFFIPLKIVITVAHQTDGRGIDTLTQIQNSGILRLALLATALLFCLSIISVPFSTRVAKRAAQKIDRVRQIKKTQGRQTDFFVAAVTHQAACVVISVICAAIIGFASPLVLLASVLTLALLGTGVIFIMRGGGGSIARLTSWASRERSSFLDVLEVLFFFVLFLVLLTFMLSTTAVGLVQAVVCLVFSRHLLNAVISFCRRLPRLEAEWRLIGSQIGAA